MYYSPTSQIPIRVLFVSTGKISFQSCSQSVKTILDRECEAKKASRLQYHTWRNYSPTWRKVSLNDNCLLNICINSYLWCQSNNYIALFMCLPLSGGQLSDPSLGSLDFSPIWYPGCLGYPLRQLGGKEDCSEDKFLTKPSPPCLFSNNRSSLLFKSWMLISISSILVKLNKILYSRK